VEITATAYTFPPHPALTAMRSVEALTRARQMSMVAELQSLAIKVPRPSPPELVRLADTLHACSYTVLNACSKLTGSSLAITSAAAALANTKSYATFEAAAQLARLEEHAIRTKPRFGEPSGRSIFGLSGPRVSSLDPFDAVYLDRMRAFQRDLDKRPSFTLLHDRMHMLLRDLDARGRSSPGREVVQTLDEVAPVAAGVVGAYQGMPEADQASIRAEADLHRPDALVLLEQLLAATREQNCSIADLNRLVDRGNNQMPPGARAMLWIAVYAAIMGTIAALASIGIDDVIHALNYLVHLTRWQWRP
jgi:hypothetical protein